MADKILIPQISKDCFSIVNDYLNWDKEQNKGWMYNTLRMIKNLSHVYYFPTYTGIGHVVGCYQCHKFIKKGKTHFSNYYILSEKKRIIVCEKCVGDNLEKYINPKYITL